MTARSRYAPPSAGTNVKKMTKILKATCKNWSTRNAAISVKAVGMEFWNLASRQPLSLMRRVKRLLIMRNAISKKVLFQSTLAALYKTLIHSNLFSSGDLAMVKLKFAHPNAGTSVKNLTALRTIPNAHGSIQAINRSTHTVPTSVRKRMEKWCPVKRMPL